MGTGRLYDYWVGKYNTDKIVKVVNDTPGADISTGDGPLSVLVSSDEHLIQINYTDKTVQQRSLSDGSLINSVTLPYQPYCLCENGNKDYFIGAAAGIIYKIPNAFTSQSVFCDMGSYGYTNIQGLFSDNANNLYPVFTGQGKTGTVSSAGVFNDADTVTVGTAPQSGIYYNGARYIVVHGVGAVKKIVGTSITATINVGDGPRSICLNTIGQLCVTNSLSNNVSIISSDLVVYTTTVGTSPYGCGSDADGRFLVVNNGSDNVSRLTQYGNAVASTISLTDGIPRNLSGDMTGMQWELLFNSSGSKHQAMTGGM